MKEYKDGVESLLLAYVRALRLIKMNQIDADEMAVNGCANAVNANAAVLFIVFFLCCFIMLLPENTQPGKNKSRQGRCTLGAAAQILCWLIDKNNG